MKFFTMAKLLRLRLVTRICHGVIAISAMAGAEISFSKADDNIAEYDQQFMEAVFCNADSPGGFFCHNVHRWTEGPVNILILYASGAEQTIRVFQNEYDVFSKATGIDTNVCTAEIDKFENSSDCKMAGTNIVILMPKPGDNLTMIRASVLSNIPPMENLPSAANIVSPVSVFDYADRARNGNACTFQVTHTVDTGGDHLRFVVLLNELWPDFNRSALCADGLFNNSIGFWQYDYMKFVYFSKFDPIDRIKILYDPSIKPGTSMENAAPEIRRLIESLSH